MYMIRYKEVGLLVSDKLYIICNYEKNQDTSKKLKMEQDTWQGANYSGIETMFISIECNS